MDLQDSCVKINLKSQEKGDLTKGAFGVSLFLVFNQTSNNFFETPCIKYFGAKLWTGIPTFIKISVSFNIFKSKLKEFLINGYDL